MAELLANVNVFKRDGTRVNVREHLRGKVVALYFSAYTCSSRKNFTPILRVRSWFLRKFYKALAGEPFEIVFVSWDHTANEQIAYLTEAHSNWCYIPFGDAAIESLSARYSINVKGIPALIVIKSNGAVVVNHAEKCIPEGPFYTPDEDDDVLTSKQVFNDWKSKCDF